MCSLLYVGHLTTIFISISFKRVHLLFFTLATSYLGCLLDDSHFFAEFAFFERFIVRTLVCFRFIQDFNVRM